MEHDLIDCLLSIEVVALAPVVAHSICEDIARAVEACRADGTANLGVTLESMLGIFVPEVEGAIGTRGREGAVNRVKANGVNREDVADVAVSRRSLAMALETEVVSGVFVVDVLNRTAAFYAADSESGAVAKCADHSCLPLERRLN